MSSVSASAQVWPGANTLVARRTLLRGPQAPLWRLSLVRLAHFLDVTRTKPGGAGSERARSDRPSRGRSHGDRGSEDVSREMPAGVGRRSPGSEQVVLGGDEFDDDDLGRAADAEGQPMAQARRDEKLGPGIAVAVVAAHKRIKS